MEKFRAAPHTLPKRGGPLAKIIPPPPGRLPSTNQAPEEGDIWATDYGWAHLRRDLDNPPPHIHHHPYGGGLANVGSPEMMGDNDV